MMTTHGRRAAVLLAAVALGVLGLGSQPALADESPAVEIGPAVEVGPAVEIGAPSSPLIDDLTDMISEGSALLPPSA